MHFAAMRSIPNDKWSITTGASRRFRRCTLAGLLALECLTCTGAGEASADVHRLARVCADEIAGKQFRKGLIDADSVEDAAAMIQAQIYREWGVAIVKGRAECLLALLECTVPNASPRSKVACGKSRDKLIERANVAHCWGGFAEAVQLRRRYAVMKEAARARRR